MRDLLKKIVTHPSIHRGLLWCVILIDNLAYKLLTKLAILGNGGTHPKHDILRYYEFFSSHLSPEDTVIDVGCGKGENSYMMAAKAKKVVGIDIKSKNIRYAETHWKRPNLEYIVGDILRYPLPHTFDKIVLSNVLEHIDERNAFLQNLHAVSSVILLRVPMINRDWVAVYKKQKGFEYRLDPTHFIEYTLEELKQELEASGWAIESYSVQFGEFWGVVKNKNESTV